MQAFTSPDDDGVAQIGCAAELMHQSALTPIGASDFDTFIDAYEGTARWPEFFSAFRLF
jgi:hypothetical protein